MLFLRVKRSIDRSVGAYFLAHPVYRAAADKVLGHVCLSGCLRVITSRWQELIYGPLRNLYADSCYGQLYCVWCIFFLFGSRWWR